MSELTVEVVDPPGDVGADDLYRRFQNGEQLDTVELHHLFEMGYL